MKKKKNRSKKPVNNKKYLLLLLFIFSLLTLTWYYFEYGRYEKTGQKATAILKPMNGFFTEGEIKFIQRARNHTEVIVNLYNAEPGNHGLHIHRVAECSQIKPNTHYNPENNIHNGPDFKEHHRGDLGNVAANGNGIVSHVGEYDSIQLSGEFSVRGLVIAVTEKPDQYNVDPDGNSGRAIACGKID